MAKAKNLKKWVLEQMNRNRTTEDRVLEALDKETRRRFKDDEDLPSINDIATILRENHQKVQKALQRLWEKKKVIRADRKSRDVRYIPNTEEYVG